MVTDLPKIDPSLIGILEQVSDPEIPVLSVLDLGVIREAILKENTVYIKLTPTYTGCPAMDTISADLKIIFQKNKFNCEIDLILSPAWTTDWLSPKGKAKLEAYGIAAPLGEEQDKRALLDGEKIVKCTHCQSTNTKVISQFGSTACKALFQCQDCLEPFDYFKCLK